MPRPIVTIRIFVSKPGVFRIGLTRAQNIIHPIIPPNIIAARNATGAGSPTCSKTAKATYPPTASSAPCARFNILSDAQTRDSPNAATEYKAPNVKPVTRTWDKAFMRQRLQDMFLSESCYSSFLPGLPDQARRPSSINATLSTNPSICPTICTGFSSTSRIVRPLFLICSNGAVYLRDDCRCQPQ